MLGSGLFKALYSRGKKAELAPSSAASAPAPGASPSGAGSLYNAMVTQDDQTKDVSTQPVVDPENPIVKHFKKKFGQG